MFDRRLLIAVAAGFAGLHGAEQEAKAQTATSGARPVQPPAGEVSEVVVTGDMPDVLTLVDRKTYRIDKDLHTQAGSVADALRNIPSLSVDVLGNVSMRGDPNVTILIDGKPAARFEGDGKGQALQDLPANQIERVEVATNPSADLATNGSGGVINLITKKARGAGASASARASLGTSRRNAAGATFGYNSPAVSATADLFYRHDTQRQSIDDRRSAFDVASGGFAPSHRSSVQSAAIETLGGSGAGDFDVTASTRLSVEARLQRRTLRFGNLQDFTSQTTDGQVDQAFTRRLDVSQAQVDGSASGGFKHSFASPGHELSGDVSFQTTRDARDRAGVTTPVALAPSADLQQIRNRLKRWDAKLDYVWPIDEGSTLKAGLDWQLDRNVYGDAGFLGPVAASLAPDPNLADTFTIRQQLTQGYLTYQTRFAHVTILAGMRAEDLDVGFRQPASGERVGRRRDGLFPSLHASWEIAPGREVSASVSRREQRPPPDQYNPFRFVLDPVTLRSGNPDLKPQLTDAAELGYDDRGPVRTWSATIYGQRTHDLVADVISDLGQGVLLTRPENISSSRTAGLELAADGRVTGSISYKVSANAYWSGILAPRPQFAGRHSVTGVSAKAGLSWRPRPTDLLQIDADLTGRRITPQGFAEPSTMVALGYRHDLTANLAILLIAQDALATYRDRQVLSTPILNARLNRDINARTVLLRFVWTSGGKRKASDIDLNADRPS